MKYPYTVKYKGEYYHAGEEVPMGASSFAKVDNPAEQEITPKEIIQEVLPEDEVPTKRDISRMPVAELRNLCKAKGIEPGDMTGTEMRKQLFEIFGL